MPNEATKKLVDGMYETLIPHMARVRVLRINKFWHSEALNRLLTTPAPNLRRLSLNFVNAPGMGGWTLPPNLFAGGAPNFRDLSLEAVQLYSTIRPGVIPTLTGLRRLFHNLKRLEYKGSEFSLMHVAPLLHAVREVILWLPPEPWRDVLSLDRPLFRILPRPWDVAQIAMVHGKIRTIHDVRYVREVNTVVTHEEAARSYLRNVMEASSAKLLKLQLDEEYWKMVVGDMGVAEFPLLTDLNIVLTPRLEADPSQPLFISLPLAGVPKCPALQMLSFWGYYSSSRRRRERHPFATVRTDDLLHFLEQVEACPAVVLRRGLTIAQDPEGLEQLRGALASLTVQLHGVQDDVL
ncbi:hypothetical protein AURDEDRAFT_111998 [Auricularia subglabra TFB-10046 SS5]|nr:hypothetical protein AURDEDRAFT_111998 [Auricularia subglabra TFB-10046 SS5]